MGDCLTIPAANSFLAKDANRISGRIARSLAINSPWINAIPTGTFAAGVSDVQRSVVQQAICPNLSQATPNWASWSCLRTPGAVQFGSTEYQYTPQVYFERGQPICVTQAFSAFKNAIRMTEMAITDHVNTLWNSKIRYQMFLNSATKIVADSQAKGLHCVIANGFATNFPNANPDSPLSFKFLKTIANYLRHSLLAGDEFMFGSGLGQHYKLISDQATLDALRDEANVRADLRAFTTGQYTKEGRDALMAYSWEGPYQGIAFGVDQSVLRANSYNRTTGVIQFVEPFLCQATTNGIMRIVNPDWLNAPLQVSFLFADRSFIREIPEEFLGEGMTTFDRQYWGGKVIWHNQKDNDCNIKGDTGFHYYDLAAAFRPERPEFMIPILHLRCQQDMGLTACTPQGYYCNTI